MNLYKIEYVFNKNKYDEDSAKANVIPEYLADINEYFNTLPTHIMAKDFFYATDIAADIVPDNTYLSITNVSPVEINIRIVEG